MPVYHYRAIAKNGTVIRNRIEEASKLKLIRKLKSNGYIPILVEQVSYKSKKQAQKKKRNIDDLHEIMKNANTTTIGKDRKRQMTLKEKINLTLAKTQKITMKDLAVFTQNFYLLKKANFNNIHALSTLIESTENFIFRGILEDILAGLEAGENMYVTMEYYSNVFPYIYVNMIKVGELSGSLTTSLRQAVEYLEDTERINKRLKEILIPNIAQFVLLLVMLIVGTIVAIPAIQNVFEELGTREELPKITLWFQGVVNGIMAYWYIPVIIILIVVGAIVSYIRTPKGKYNFDYFKYTAPVFGGLIFALDFSRLMKAMLLNLNNGMRVQDSLNVSKNVVKNHVMVSIVETSINNILVGSSWIEPFEQSNLASPMTTEMLKIGMQTDLSEMMEKLVEYMEVDINNQLAKIMKALPQIVYAIVGVVLIFFVLVVLVPCIQVYMGSFLFSSYGL